MDIKLMGDKFALKVPMHSFKAGEEFVVANFIYTVKGNSYNVMAKPIYSEDGKKLLTVSSISQIAVTTDELNQYFQKI